MSGTPSASAADWQVHADEQRADEPRRAGDGHGVDVTAGQTGHCQRAVGQLGDDLHVRAREAISGTTPP